MVISFFFFDLKQLLLKFNSPIYTKIQIHEDVCTF